MNNNTLEFFVRMRDLMSGGLAKIAATSKSVFKRVESDVNSTQKKMKFMANSVDELKQKLQDVNKVRFGTVLQSEFKAASREAKELQKEIDKLQGKSGGSSGLMGFLKPAIAAVSIGSIMSMAGSSVMAANQFETQKKTYGVLTGNAGVGNELTSQLRGLKENTIMGMAVYPTAQTMLGFGISAKDIIPDIKMLGDVSMGDANKLQHLTLAFSEVAAAGRITAKEVRMMVYQGFNPLQEMSRTTGKSLSKLREEMRAGDITSQMVVDAFKSATGEGGRFNNMMAQIATTSGGKLAILQGRIASLKISFGELLQPAVNATVVALTNMITTIKHWFDVPVAKQVDDQIQKIYELQLKLTSLTSTEKERAGVLKELEQINPNITKGINAQSIEYGKLQENILGVVAALNQKKIADRFQTENSDTIYDYNDAVQKQAQMIGHITSSIVKADPTLAGRTDLTFGQKQMEAMRILREKIASGNVTANYHTSSTGSMGSYMGTSSTNEQDELTMLRSAIASQQKAAATITRLSPKYAKVQSDIKAATDAYNKVFGLDNMATAGGIKAGSEDDDGTGGKDKKSKVADGITSGGPRVVNINGVTMKIAENMQVHTANTEDFMKQMEPKMKEMWLRTLNSGASVQ